MHTASARNGFAWPRSDLGTCQHSTQKSTWALRYASRHNWYDLFPGLQAILALALRSGVSSMLGSSLASSSCSALLDPRPKATASGHPFHRSMKFWVAQPLVCTQELRDSTHLLVLAISRYTTSAARAITFTRSHAARRFRGESIFVQAVVGHSSMCEPGCP